MNTQKKQRYFYHWGLRKWFLVVPAEKSYCRVNFDDPMEEWCTMFTQPVKHCMDTKQCHKRIFKEIPNA